MAGDPGPRPMAESLDRLLGNLNAPSVDVLDVVFRDWQAIVGPDLAERSRPRAIEGDKLTVVAVDAAWAAELRWLEKQVVERVTKATGTTRIQRIQVRVSPSV